MCYLVFNELWTNKRQKFLTHTHTSYLFALSLCDFTLFPRQEKPVPAGLHCSLGGMQQHPHPKIKGC